MYVPKQFREERQEVLVAAMRAIHFGALVIATDLDLAATHIPFLVHETDDGVALEAHVARANETWRRANQTSRAIVIFQGPQAYIHPGWLETKRKTRRGVPTWNYIAIHCHGAICAIHDKAWILNHVRALSDLNEAGRPEPWSVDDAPLGYIEKAAEAIVGLRLRVDRIEGAWKLIQHHPEENRRGVREALATSHKASDRDLGAAMELSEKARTQPSPAFDDPS